MLAQTTSPALVELTDAELDHVSGGLISGGHLLYSLPIGPYTFNFDVTKATTTITETYKGTTQTIYQYPYI